jgi:hypothetical protein
MSMLPERVRSILPLDTAVRWETVAPIIHLSAHSWTCATSASGCRASWSAVALYAIE